MELDKLLKLPALVNALMNIEITRFSSEATWSTEYWEIIWSKTQSPAAEVLADRYFRILIGNG